MSQATQTTRPTVAAFAGMTREDLAALAPLLTRVVIPAGRTVFDARLRARAMMLVEAGAIDVVRAAPGGARSAVTVVGPGQSVGEVALLDGRPRRTVGVARVDTTCLVLEPDGLARLRRDAPATAARLMVNLGRVLAGRLNRVWKRLAPPPVPVDPVYGRRR